MSLNGIDVASYQTGIDFGKVPCDFVIVKATQGTNYRNPAYKSQLENAQKNGKLTGVYHYITGAGAEAESLYFYSVIRDQVGKSIMSGPARGLWIEMEHKIRIAGGDPDTIIFASALLQGWKCRS